MKIYGMNKKFIVVNRDENLKILYSVYSNSVLALNEKAFEIFEYILDIAKSHNGEIIEVYKKYGEENIIQFINVLNDYHILFKSEEEMKKSDFYLVYLERKKFNLHKAYLHLTQRCNLQCKYYYNANNLGTIKDLKTEIWKQILFTLQEKGFNHVIFTGGEVLLRKDLLVLAKYAKDLGFELNILTNGTFELERELIETADTIEISLDSLEEDINEINRINSKNFKVINNIFNVPVDLRQKIVIKTVLTNSNAHSIVSMREKLEKAGFKKLEIISQQPNNPTEENVYPENVVPKKVHKFDLGKITKCNACYEIIAVNANGDIYPCQALIKPNMLLTNIFKENWFEEIKKHSLTETFFKDDINNVKCKECEFKYLCGGPCKAVSYNVSGSLYEGRGSYCKYAKKECLEYLKSIDFGGSQ